MSLATVRATRCRGRAQREILRYIRVHGTVHSVVTSMESDGRAAARAIDTLRSRTGLIPAHAAQLLALADGSIDAAIELFDLEPTMFNVSQHSLLCQPDLRSGIVNMASDSLAPRSTDVEAPLAPQLTCAVATTAPATAFESAPAPLIPPALRIDAPQLPSFAAAPAACASPTIAPTDAPASPASSYSSAHTRGTVVPKYLSLFFFLSHF